MKILKESAIAQTLSIIPRSYVYLINYVITDEQTNVAVTVSDFIPVFNNGYIEILNTFDLKENKFYKLDVYNGTTLIYRDKIFCTNQDIDTYNINNGVYA